MAEMIECDARVPAHLDGARLDQVAAQLFADYSRSRLQTWIRRGELRVDGHQHRPRDKVAEGSVLSIAAELQTEIAWGPENPPAEKPLQFIYQDSSILVLDKPAGLVVHPAAGHPGGTLVNALLAQLPELAQLPRAGIVHRLDRDTSGIMVVARTLAAHNHLVTQLQARTVKREYCAVCTGVLTGGGTVEAPIGRHPRQRKKMAVLSAGGKQAITHYRVAKRFAHHTQITVNLETGRTHQIRVHMAHRHHPLVGDPSYGGRPRIPAGASERLIEALRGFPRQALHARALGLLHPETQQLLQFDCPVPPDLGGLLDVLAAESPQLRDYVGF